MDGGRKYSCQMALRNAAIFSFGAVFMCLVIFSRNTNQFIPNTIAENTHSERKLCSTASNSASYSYGDSWKYSSLRHPVRNPCETCRKRFPGAIIAGIQKCGTGALLVFMNLHPEIAAAARVNEEKGVYQEMELHFFAGKLYDNGLEWYRNMMPCSFSNQMTIEKDPPYFYRESSAPRIRDMDPATRIIFIIKDPIERALSMHAMYLDEGDTNGTFETDILDKNGKLKVNQIYLRFSSYNWFIDSWIKYFGLKQIHFVDGHKFEANPLTELQAIENFLRIEPYFKRSMFWFNETKNKTCFYSKDGDPHCMGARKGRKHQAISKQLRQKLQTYFKPMNEKFFKAINRRFDWGY